MSIEADLRKRLTEALKAKDLRTANCIRMVNTKVMERRTAKGFQGEVGDELWADVIASYKKSLEKARKDYEAAGERGAQQLADLDYEIEFLKQFLPPELGPAEVRGEVKAAIEELGASDPKQAGRVVGAVMKKHKGRVDPGLVKKIAGEELDG